MARRKDIKSIVVLVLLGVLISLLGCKSGKLDAVPPEWVAEWETQAEKFKGFTFEITGGTIVFSDMNAENKAECYPISWVQKNEKVANLFTIHCKTTEGLDYEFAFYYQASDGGTIRLKNQKAYVWKKAGK